MEISLKPVKIFVKKKTDPCSGMGFRNCMGQSWFSHMRKEIGRTGICWIGNIRNIEEQVIKFINHYVYLIIIKGTELMGKDIEQLQVELRKFAKDRDWDQFHSPKNLAMAIKIKSCRT